MPSHKKDLILDSFQKMDLNMLQILLDDANTYQSATKETFIEKIKDVFAEFQSQGDTYITAYKGFCCSDECENLGCEGYSFVGNNSRTHIELIFEETENDIVDIDTCYSFVTHEDIGETGNMVDIDISEDEKADFVPDVDYMILDQKYKGAIAEILKHQDEYMTKDIYSMWLEKHDLLYKSFQEAPLSYTNFIKFYRLFRSLKQVLNFSVQEEAAIEALIEYPNENGMDEGDLLCWLATYEALGLHLTQFGYEGIDYEQRENNVFFTVGGLKISTIDFDNIINFKFLFDSRYWDLLDKYSTFTEEDMERINDDSTISENWNILSYHMEKRGMLD